MIAQDSQASDTTGIATHTKRLRALKACEPCRERKRKCDGRKPCGSCVRYEYQCHFSPGKQTKSNHRIKTPPALLPSRSSSDTSIPKSEKESPNNERTRQANAGVLFPSSINSKLGPCSDAPKVQGLGWNLGLRYKYAASDKSMTWIISKREWQTLFEIYCQKVHSVYNFLDLDAVIKESSKRWEDPNATNSYDHVLCGIAALASLFSSERLDDREHLLVQCAKDILEATSLVRDPTFSDAQAWLLRTLYLRCNSPPHAAWMASAITMQVAEAVGLHQEATPEPPDLRYRRRTFWLARLLNTWISDEYGRSRIMPAKITCSYPPMHGPDGTEMMKLFVVSLVLDPERDCDATELENALLQVEDFAFDHPALALSRCNLTFVIYRRLRMTSATLRQDLLDKVVSIGRQGLIAASEAATSNSPWWHVSNVPFQFVYILLAMDCSEYLPYVETAISTLRAVTSRFQTSMMRQALHTAEATVQMFQKRKEQDFLALQRAVPTQWPQPAFTTQPFDGIFQATDVDQNLPVWPDDLLWAAPSLNNVDWNQFWVDPSAGASGNAMT